MGKSSGGFGAMITPMLRPDLFGALATHAGDTLYEQCYLREFGSAVRALRGYDGDIWRWWDDFNSRVSFTKPEDMLLVGFSGSRPAFSAREDGTVELPFDPRTGVVDEAVWQRWLDWDPVRMARRYADALRSVHSIWIDAGTRDDFFLDLGAEAFRAELGRIGVAGRRRSGSSCSSDSRGDRLPVPDVAFVAVPADGGQIEVNDAGPRYVVREEGSGPRSEMERTMRNRWWAAPVLARGRG